MCIRDSPTASTVPLAPTAQDQWIPVDPSSYSNPYTDAPIYTSGPQPAVSPDAQPAPAPPAGFGPPVAYPPAPPGTAHAAPWVPQAPVAEPGGYAVPATYPAAPGQPVNPAAPTTPGPYSLVAPVPGAGPSDPMLAPDHQPEKGELKIKERRSWRTWQLLAAVLVAAVVGMWFNGNSGSASGIPGSGSGGSSGGYKLPPAAGSPSTTAAAAGGAATSTTAAGGATTTTVAGTATSTTAAGTTATTAPVVLAPASVLVPETQQAGNWTSPAFTIAGGTWNIGWAFQCVPVPTVTPTFQIFVVNNGASPGATPAVTSSAASGSAVTPLTSAGGQQVIVQTSAACRWAVKVTGSGSGPGRILRGATGSERVAGGRADWRRGRGATQELLRLAVRPVLPLGKGSVQLFEVVVVTFGGSVGAFQRGDSHHEAGRRRFDGPPGRLTAERGADDGEEFVERRRHTHLLNGTRWLVWRQGNCRRSRKCHSDRSASGRQRRRGVGHCRSGRASGEEPTTEGTTLAFNFGPGRPGRSEDLAATNGCCSETLCEPVDLFVWRSGTEPRHTDRALSAP